MSNKFFQVRSFITYWLDAVAEHSLHSPFFYDFYTQVVKATSHPERYRAIEALRRALTQDLRVIDVHDHGAGSQHTKSAARKVSQIAATSLSPASYSQLYVRIAEMLKSTDVIELGTSLGINTLYLASIPGSTVTTFEGAPGLAAHARNLFKQHGASNIGVVEGNIDHTLPRFLDTVKKVDFVLMDANHRYEPTLKYFEWIAQKTHARSVVILDDIHYSPGMERAWNTIKHHDLVYASADLYRCGLVFFDPSLNKQHVVLQR